MFQNIEGVVNNGQPYGKTKIKKLSIFANVFELRNIAIYVISFMVSLIGLGGELSPFSISIFAACFANSIPLLGVAIVSVIGSSIKYGVTGALSYMLTALVMIATFFIIKPKYNEEERNEKVKVSKNVFIASFLVQFAKTMMAGFTIYDLLVGITFSVVAVVFYKIFVNSLIVLQDFREKRAFSIEEVIGASLLISIAVSCFGELNIWKFINIWIIYKKYIKYINCNDTRLEKWNISWNNIRCNNWCDNWNNSINRTNNDCCICNIWNDCGNIK